MKDARQLQAGRLPPLPGKTAEDLMTPNPVSIRDEATVREAVTLLTDRKISACPVVDRTGRPTGVLSRADVLVYDRKKVEHLLPVAEYYDRSELTTKAEERGRSGFQVETPDDVRVCDIMTPIVFWVAPGDPAAWVIEEMVALKVHRLFVLDGDGVLVGVISALDVLRHLCM